MIRRVEQIRPAGERHPRARLTAHDAELIRQLHAAGLSYRAIAEKFEVSWSCVANVVRWRTYWCR